MVLMRNGVIPIGLLLMTSNVNADELSSGDTAWMLTATALVLFMTIPGLSLFYAGMVRSKNVLSVFDAVFRDYRADFDPVGSLRLQRRLWR